MKKILKKGWQIVLAYFNYMIISRVSGKITIEINEEDLLCGVKSVPPEDFYFVEDKEKFLSYATNNLLDIGDDGDFNSMSDFCRILDKLVETAAELDEGVGYKQV